MRRLAKIHNLHRPEECRHLKFYDHPGETLSMWKRRGDFGWHRYVVRYDDILAYDICGIHIEFVMKQGGALVAGFNMPSLLLLLEKRVLRSLRVLVGDEISKLNDDQYAKFDTDIITNCIVPTDILFSATERIFNPPDFTPKNAVLH